VCWSVPGLRARGCCILKGLGQPLGCVGCEEYTGSVNSLMAAINAAPRTYILAWFGIVLYHYIYYSQMSFPGAAFPMRLLTIYQTPSLESSSALGSLRVGFAPADRREKSLRLNRGFAPLRAMTHEHSNAIKMQYSVLVSRLSSPTRWRSAFRYHCEPHVALRGPTIRQQGLGHVLVARWWCE